MKKSFIKRAVFVLALLLALTCALAHAEVNAQIPWRDEAETIALVEAYYGPYGNWPTGWKNTIEFYLDWIGALEKSDDTRKLESEEYMNLLSDEELNALIDKVVCGGLGLAPEEITALSLAECVWGKRETWGEEHRAFWAELQEKLARIDSYEPTKREERLRLMLGLDQQPETELVRDMRAFSGAMFEQGYYNFASWPLEEKARYSRELAPRIRQAYEEDTEYVYEGDLVKTVYEYGLPGEGDLTEEAAREAALDTAAQAFGKEREAFEVRYVFFDVTDAQKPLWRVYLLSQGEEDYMHDEWRVQLDARTGEILEASAIPLPYQVTRWENWLNGL